MIRRFEARYGGHFLYPKGTEAQVNLGQEITGTLADLGVVWEKVYDQEFPCGDKPYRAIPGMRPNTEYVYVLDDGADVIVYVGRSFRPADRFTKHRRKCWWRDVETLTLFAVYGHNEKDTTMRTVQMESVLITALAPYGNKAAGQRREEWYAAYQDNQARVLRLPESP